MSNLSPQVVSPKLEECQKWCAKAREILKKKDKKNKKTDMKVTEEVKMSDSSKEIKGLLEKAEAQGLAKTPEWQKFKGEFETLSLSAHNITEKVSKKKKSVSDAKPEILKISNELRDLTEKMRSAMVVINPSATKVGREEILEAARNRPLYEDKRDRIEAAIENLQGLIGSETQITALQELLKAGKALEPDYAKALKALAGLTSLLKAGREASEKFTKSVEGLKEARKALEEYQEVAGIGDPEFIVKAQANIENTLRKLTKPGLTKEFIEAGKKDLVKLAGELTTKKGNCLKAQKEMNEKEQEVSKKIDDLRTYASAPVLGPLLSQFRAGQALGSTQRYADALNLLTTTETNVDLEYLKNKGFYDSWQKIDEECAKAKPTLDKAIMMGNPVIEKTGNRLIKLIDQTLRAELVVEHDFKEAVKVSTDRKLLADLAMLKKLVEIETENANKKPGEKKALNPKFSDPALQFSAEVLLLSAQVRDKSGEVKGEIQTLAEKKFEELKKKVEEKAAREQSDPRGILNKFNPLLAKEWSKLESAALDESKPDNDRQLAFQKMQNTLPQLLKDIEALVEEAKKGFPPLPKEDTKQPTTDDDATKFEKARLAAQAALDDLLDLDLTQSILETDPKLSVMQNGYDAALLQAKSPPPTGTNVTAVQYDVAAMEKVRESAASKVKMMTEGLKSRRAIVEKKLDEFANQIDAAAKKNDDYKNYFAKLRTRVAESRGLASSYLFSAVGEAEQRCDALTKELLALRNDLQDDKKNFKAVEAEKKALKDRLEKDDVKNFQPTVQATLLARLEHVLPDALHLLSPADALAELKKFEKEVAAAELAAAEGKKQREEVKKKVEELKVKAAKVKEKAPGFYDVLSKRISAIENGGKGNEQRSFMEIESVNVLLSTAEKPPENLQELENTAQREALEAEREKTAFEAAREIFKKNALHDAEEKKKEVNGLLGLGRSWNKDAYEQMETAYEEAKKMAERGDLSAAYNKLQNATALAKYFVSRPLKPAATAHTALKKLNNSWKSAVGSYLKSVGDLQSKMNSDTEVANQRAKTSAPKLDPLLQIFSAAAFDKAVATLASSAKDPEEIPERRALKEEALAEVRRFERIINQHRVLKTAEQNPFLNLEVQPLRDALSALGAALKAS